MAKGKSARRTKNKTTSKNKRAKGQKMGKVRRFFREIASEMRKVSWPSTSELINYTIVVVVFIVIIAGTVGVIDFFLGKLLEIIIR